MTQRERMLSGGLYSAADPELFRLRQEARRLTRLYNQTAEDQPEERRRLLEALLGGVGENAFLEPPFRCDYGGNITVGRDFYANYDCIILDVCPVTIGDRVLFGPRVGLYGAGHPLDPEVRAGGLENGGRATVGKRCHVGAGAVLAGVVEPASATPVVVEDDVLIGANAVVLEGVHIGKGAVIAAGAMVTRDIPSGVLAAGVPCRVLRPLNERDRTYWRGLQKVWRQD